MYSSLGLEKVDVEESIGHESYYFQGPRKYENPSAQIPRDVLCFVNDDMTCALNAFVTVLSNTARFSDYIGNSGALGEALRRVHDARDSGPQSIDSVRNAVGGYFARRMSFAYQGNLGLLWVLELIEKLPGLREAVTARTRGFLGVREETVLNFFPEADTPGIAGSGVRFEYLPRLLLIQMRPAAAEKVSWTGDILPETLSLKQGNGEVKNYRVRGALVSPNLFVTFSMIKRNRWVVVKDEDVTYADCPALPEWQLSQLIQMTHLLVYEEN